MERTKNFVAIDVETANRLNQICQIGIAVVKDGEIVETRSWLVKPPGNHYEEGYIRVHGITPERTKDAPFFCEVWPELEPYLVGQHLVAHNCGTEKSALTRTFEKDYPEIMVMNVDYNRITCSMRPFGQRGLDACCQAFGLTCENHHDAGFDADRCARVYLKYLEGAVPDWSLVVDEPKKKVFGREEKLKGDDLRMDLSEADPDSPFYCRKVVITGTFSLSRKELGQLLKVRLGADIDSNITKKTHFVFIGDKPGWEKLPKLDKLIHDGYNIRKLYESDLQAILRGEWEDYRMDGDMKKNLDFTYSHFENHRVFFSDGCNVIARKELYYGKGLSGDRDLFAQITGNLGACGDYEMYPETNLCVLSDSTLEKLQRGEKDETILYLQDYYNSGRAITFEMQFISEGDILRFAEERIRKTGDESTGYYYRRYMGEIPSEG